ncbi:hypothetical protein B566_EDAN002525 [Ephemera danica]|nr:hypothetical protein B566_EDAN002525 [Ephemera danica]
MAEGRQTINIKVEDAVAGLFDSFEKTAEVDPELPYLYRQKHVAFLRRSIVHLSRAYECLDASRPWLCYWILHSLELLGARLAPNEATQVTQFLARCQSENGGFSGGPGQHPHLAATYAAVNALATIGTKEALEVVCREKLQRFLASLRSPDGSFHMHEGGEADIRGVYCALSIARLTNVYTKELFAGSADWILSCQTYEGGFAGVPGMEAHGGYAFCGLAALFMLQRESNCDLQALLRWLVNRQMRFEGGFQGRTNKLVDGCYSFWQGATFPLLHQALGSVVGEKVLNSDRWLFHQEALQEYLLICCQHPNGGLIDKPGNRWHLSGNTSFLQTLHYNSLKNKTF